MTVEISSVADLLKAAKAKIADPKNWTKGEFARDKQGMPRLYMSSKACQWCASGALQSFDMVEEDCHLDSLILLESVLPPNRDSVVEFNDDETTTHADIMKLFDKAIAIAEKE